jgi:hypothetical protein
LAFIKLGGCPVEIKSYEETLKALCLRSADTLVIPACVKKIGMNAFSSFGSLKTLVFEEGVEEIGEDFVWDSNSLTDVWLPSTIKKIHAGAFTQDEDAAKITVHINKPKDSISGSPWNADNLVVEWGSKYVDENRVGNKILLGEKTITAADGTLTGYPLTRLLKCIPNHSTITVEIEIYLPNGVTAERVEVGDFVSGREYKVANQYVDFTKLEPVKTADGGTLIAISWEEYIDVASYVWDDDSTKALVSFYLSSEIPLSGSAKKQAALSIRVFNNG